jgi:hypothetical protein
MRVVMLGDVVGEPGMRAVEQLLPQIRQRWKPDLVLANGENAADGSGLTATLYQRLRRMGVDGVTLGDHVYRRMQIARTLESESNIVRPANLPRAATGRTWMKLLAAGDQDRPPLYVTTVLGRIFPSVPADNPFETVDSVLGQLPDLNPLVIVEAHAEATSEKRALGYYLDGRVAAVLGTHTHVATADAQILPHGTAYITDLGMCGPHDSIIGRRIDRVLKTMTTAMPSPFDVASGDPRVCGVFLEIDTDRRVTTDIERIEMKADPHAPPF